MTRRIVSAVALLAVLLLGLLAYRRTGRAGGWGWDLPLGPFDLVMWGRRVHPVRRHRDALGTGVAHAETADDPDQTRLESLIRAHSRSPTRDPPCIRLARADRRHDHGIAPDAADLLHADHVVHRRVPPAAAVEGRDELLTGPPTPAETHPSMPRPRPRAPGRVFPGSSTDRSSDPRPGCDLIIRPASGSVVKISGR
jgi:hypothetical protein